jgi:hypothetical protein
MDMMGDASAGAVRRRGLEAGWHSQSEEKVGRYRLAYREKNEEEEKEC